MGRAHSISHSHRTSNFRLLAQNDKQTNRGQGRSQCFHRKEHAVEVINTCIGLELHGKLTALPDSYLMYSLASSHLDNHFQISGRCSCGVLCRWLADISQTWCLMVVHTQMEVVLHAVTHCHDTEYNVPDSCSTSVPHAPLQTLAQTYAPRKGFFQSILPGTIPTGHQLLSPVPVPLVVSRRISLFLPCERHLWRPQVPIPMSESSSSRSLMYRSPCGHDLNFRPIYWHACHREVSWIREKIISLPLGLQPREEELTGAARFAIEIVLTLGGTKVDTLLRMTNDILS